MSYSKYDSSSPFHPVFFSIQLDNGDDDDYQDYIFRRRRHRSLFFRVLFFSLAPNGEREEDFYRISHLSFFFRSFYLLVAVKRVGFLLLSRCENGTRELFWFAVFRFALWFNYFAFCFVNVNECGGLYV